MRWAVASVLLLAGCAQVADNVARRTARSVVNPVVGQYMPTGEAEAATTCIIDNASAGELGALSRDIGTRAGTSTVQIVADIAVRPATRACLMSQGLPLLSRLTY